MRIYVSGPISLGGRLLPAELSERVQVFNDEADRLRALGYTVDNPCDHPQQDSWEDYMKLDLPQVCSADVVAVLPDWLHSRGSVLEVFVATQLGIPVVPVAEIVRSPRCLEKDGVVDSSAKEGTK